MDIGASLFNDKEYDFSSLGQRLRCIKRYEYPDHRAINEAEKSVIKASAHNAVRQELAGAILEADIVEGRTILNGFELSADVIVITPTDYYKMLNVVTQLMGSVRVRLPR